MNEKQKITDSRKYPTDTQAIINDIKYAERNEKQQIAEAERRFENWWENDTSQLYRNYSESIEEFTKRVAKEAWMNGAFVARENN